MFGSLALHSIYYKSIYFKTAFSLFDKPNHNMTQLHEIHVIFLCYLVFYFSCGVVLRMYVEILGECLFIDIGRYL